VCVEGALLLPSVLTPSIAFPAPWPMYVVDWLASTPETRAKLMSSPVGAFVAIGAIVGFGLIVGFPVGAVVVGEGVGDALLAGGLVGWSVEGEVGVSVGGAKSFWPNQPLTWTSAIFITPDVFLRSRTYLPPETLPKSRVCIGDVSPVKIDLLSTTFISSSKISSSELEFRPVQQSIRL